MKPPVKRKLQILLGFVLIIFNLNVFGQVIKVAGDVLKETVPGDANTPLIGTFLISPSGGPLREELFQFELSNGTSGHTWIINGCSPSPCSVIITDSNTGNAKFTVPDHLPPSGQGIIEFTISADGGTYERQVKINFRPAIDYALVLDKSGSMGWAFDGTISAPANQRRWDGLVTSIGVLASKLNAFSFSEDKIGIRYFQSTAETPPTAPFNGNLISLQTNAAGVKNEVQLRSPGGNTALGDGMIAGRDLLLNAPAVTDHQKVMFVLSDGAQNAGDHRVDDTNPTKTLSGQDLNGPTDQIKFYTISLGSGTGSNPLLMQHIAQGNTAAIGADLVANYLHISTIAGVSDLGNIATVIGAKFDAMVQKIQRGSSPHLVDVRQKKYVKTGERFTFSEKFDVNNGIDKVFIALITETRNEPVVAVSKGGINLTQYAHQDNGPGFKTLTIQFPIPGHPEIKPGGSWEILSFLGTKPAVAPQYYLSLTVDDHLVHPEYSLGNNQFEVGKALKPSIKLTMLGKDIKNATVKAIILRPGEDIGNFIATSQGEFPAFDTKDPGSPGEQKLAELLQDSLVAAKLKLKENILTLNYDAGTGEYGGSFNGLTVSGDYQVLFRIESQDSTYGKVVRYEPVSFNVIHPDIDIEQSSVSLTTSRDGQTILTFRPKSSNNFFWGPGWSGGIKIDFPGAKINNIKDKGDGTYEVVIDGKLEGKGSISVGGKYLINGDAALLYCYNADASFWQKIQCWFLNSGLPGWLIWVLILLLLGGIAWWWFTKP